MVKIDVGANLCEICNFLSCNKTNLFKHMIFYILDVDVQICLRKYFVTVRTVIRQTNTTLSVSGTPLTAIALFQGSMDKPLVFLKSSHTMHVEGFLVL